MSRDLTREKRLLPRNGDQGDEIGPVLDAVLAAQDAPEPMPEPLRPAPTARELRPEPMVQLEARRDWVLARVALMLIDAAKLLDPITRIVMARFLALASLAAATGIAVYAIKLTEGWERVAIAGLFTALAALLIRKGQS